MFKEPMKIVSGGQTGVDRAELDAAIECGLPHGGWVPLGRQAEDGQIDRRYAVRETPTTERSLRTEWNIRDSDATLILTKGELKNGTRLTWELANISGKSVFIVDLNKVEHNDAVETVSCWLKKVCPRILNVAGPPDSETPGIRDQAYLLLCQVLSAAATFPRNDACHSNDTDVVLARYQQAQENFRHWDQIRWLTPYWFIAVFAGFAAMVANWSKELRATAVWAALCGFVLFGSVCFLLMVNLIKYHNLEIEKCKETIEHSPLTPYQREVLLTRLPFALKGKPLLETATFYLSVIIAVLTVAVLIFLFIHHP